MKLSTSLTPAKRGFAAMDAEAQREIARKGGRAAHARGTAHEYTADEARAAGRKGGAAVSQSREHMSTIGRAGGLARAARARERSGTDVYGRPLPLSAD